jgi:hypothetical protein
MRRAAGVSITGAHLRSVFVNSKQKEAFKGLVAELREVVPQEDRSKLGQLERIVGELRRERGELSTKVAELASLRDATKAATAKAE